MDSEPRGATEAGDRALAKLRAFVATLDADERAAIAVLLAPAVERALEGPGPWSATRLSQWMAATLGD